MRSQDEKHRQKAEKVARDVAEFIAKGGEIQEIPRGVSGEREPKRFRRGGYSINPMAVANAGRQGFKEPKPPQAAPSHAAEGCDDGKKTG